MLLPADIVIPLTLVSFISLSFSVEISESAILMPIKLAFKQLLETYSINGLILVFVIRAIHEGINRHLHIVVTYST